MRSLTANHIRQRSVVLLDILVGENILGSPKGPSACRFRLPLSAILNLCLLAFYRVALEHFRPRAGLCVQVFSASTTVRGPFSPPEGPVNFCGGVLREVSHLTRGFTVPEIEVRWQTVWRTSALVSEAVCWTAQGPATFDSLQSVVQSAAPAWRLNRAEI